ncbi:protein of unknown function (plasmid) [Rhodovastum atsumiense]|nr:protein of unknown function [Rhodovastum atsumiense]
MKAACCLVLRDTDNIVAAHGHIPMILPPQPLDRNQVSRVAGDVFCCQNFTQVTGSD